MTAEIAVMNQEAVALAADSAVSGPKIFTSANKIFALSKYQPVAVMVNDSAQFMGIPWETIIKTYRAQLDKQSFATLRQHAADFLGFFDKPNPLFPEAAQQAGNYLLFTSFFREVLNHIDSQLEERTAQGEELTGLQIEDEATSVITEVHQSWMSEDNFPSLPAQHASAVTHDYQPVIDSAIIDAFEQLPLSDEARQQLREIAGALVSKDRANPFSPYHSGIVIAGFGRDEYFPSLYEFELDTVALDRLKYSQADVSKIGPEDGAAVIRAFAQREQVATFMEGLDSTLAQAIIGYWADELPELVGIAADQMNLDQASKTNLLTSLQDACQDSLDAFAQSLRSLTHELNVQPIIRVVGMMPKDELAAMAESLVNLTSFKRKVTEEAETVGGPIDVAVISKGDGLIWVKRKHYFEPELNQQFFANYYAEGK